MANPRIYTYSVVFSSSEQFKDKTPYICAILEDDDGKRFASLVDGYKDGVDIAIGREIRKTGQNSAGQPTFSL